MQERLSNDIYRFIDVADQMYIRGFVQVEIVFVRHGVPDYSLADARKMTQLEKDYAPLHRDCIPFIKSQSESDVFSGAEIIVSSPYTRALQTAELINRKLGLELFVEHDLREWKADLNGGYIDLKERDRRWNEYRCHLKDKTLPLDVKYETTTGLRARVTSVLQQYKSYKKIVVVGHFNVFESLIGYQEQGIGCAEYKCFNFNKVANM